MQNSIMAKYLTGDTMMDEKTQELVAIIREAIELHDTDRLNPRLLDLIEAARAWILANATDPV